ncbi:CGNR zinc finger domain-containing protein [Fulvivirga sp. 29W222]|uniref:CGNR zinc finger domain-containing protein n=1 Tax=Fulvivirga marina TaxID=2494733 RepID=A0A937KC58_9BACT|nr:CGNR zinc finger domain-containing protein [Fulvivirga marina]MBL6444903.1 CGNR zinc finger domain-containing protein [Fulvivirga marina]
MTHERSIDSISLHGGWLCLDFINTVHDWTVADPEDYLVSYDDVLRWSARMNTLPAEDIDQLQKTFQHSEKADLLLKGIVEARAVLYSLFIAIIRQQEVGAVVQEQFNELLSETMSKLGVDVSDTPSYFWKGKELRKPIYPVIKSAYDLLMSGKLGRVKECGACGWVFLDKSKNNSRRWCDMQACGSAAKAKRYYRKKKQEEQH